MMAESNSSQPDKMDTNEVISPPLSPTNAPNTVKSGNPNDDYCDSIDDDDLTPDSAAIEWIRSKINVQGFDAYSDSEWKEEFEMTISDFLASPHITRLLISRRSEDGEIQFSTNLLLGDNGKEGITNSLNSNTVIAPTQKRDGGDAERVNAHDHDDDAHFGNGTTSSPCSKWQFFLKEGNVSLISLEATRSAVQYGMVSGNRLESLEAMMQNVYLPSILSNEWWPDSVQKELGEKLHKFMAALTESVNLEKGKTVLYVPRDIGDKATVKKDESGTANSGKHSVRRLESTLIHWTRQIEEMVKNQTVENRAGDDSLGPLQEIEFWRARSIDLVSVREQLEKAGVLSILAMLRSADSTYLERFNALAGSDRIWLDRGRRELVILGDAKGSLQ